MLINEHKCVENGGELMMEEKDVLLIRKKSDANRTFSIRIDDALATKIENVSNEAGISRNEMISKLLEFAVNRCKLTN